MARDLTKVKSRFTGSLKSIYSAANYGANATSLTVEQLQRLISILHSSHNSLREAWDDLVAMVGADIAREILSHDVSSVPETLATDLIQVRTDIQAILDVYQSNYGAGISAKTFSYALENGLFTGGFSEDNVGSGALSTLNGLCATLESSVELITPVS